jgi:hypothetical protein
MSLTSYRAAPPRAMVWVRVRYMRRSACICGKRLVLCWPGDDLLSRVLRHSTIGAEAFNGRVRDGIGFGRLAQVTGPAKNKGSGRGPRQHWVLPEKDVLSGYQPWLSRAAKWSGHVAPRSEAPQGRRPPAPMRRSFRHGVPVFLSRQVHSRSWIMRDDQADRAISTGQLNASPRLHIQPINVVVFHGPDREFSFRGGFPA